ncbi:hypothetical protein ZYGR_0I07180 [Zygosaccharomyces rouxii]|uniref:ZYRO0C16962p n=2 Tax=Zygosaccharomyces rouxii TaxID=4956 RepID=C5DUI2_ZYGRC|nr:uncharacterized protein ZYRO0C16962g [Zygosaccharomyces rouxii]KAH9201386.1 hypothetical protein LQ764DRAFT_78598 [Zygosaccharomyces rouxii]GAV48421.1 hypothetical protein ZYGR_0I07180 [Zygosaccharomyces rouxii]CAR27443.1 ZYRO0C16962p [Zygosaccharomyces rouxii]
MEGTSGKDYKDTIVSVFQRCEDDRSNLTPDVLKTLVDRQAEKPGVQEQDISYCAQTLKIYTELLKIELFLEKAWDIKILGKSVLVKFELSEADNESRENNGNGFYKDIALKCIRKCDKLSIRLQNLQRDAASVRDYVASMQSRILEDSITLLLELWFTCKVKLRALRNRIAGVFIDSKLLLIDVELESLKTHLSTKKDYAKVIPAYRSFMKILVEQLQDAQATGDQTLFDECLQVFLDVEAMYNSMNFSWLLSDNKLLQDSLTEADAKNHAVADPFVIDSLSPSSLETDNSDPELRSRSSSASVPMSTSTDLSLMLERTQLSKELPSLLATFNNAKRMEQEIENIRMTPNNNHNNPNNVTSIYNSNTPGLPSSNTFKAKLMMMNQQQHNLWNQFLPNATTFSPKNHYGSGNHILSSLYGMNNNQNNSTNSNNRNKG